MAKWDVTDGRTGAVYREWDEDDIRRALADGLIGVTDYVRPSEGGRYCQLSQIPALAALAPGRRRRRRAAGDGLDLTPMVDVVFLLLLFFMLTASYTMQSTIDVPRPDTAPSGARQAMPTLEDLADDHLIVRVKADNSIWLDEVRVEPGALDTAIRDTRRNTKRNELILSADPAAHHETVVRVLDAANEAGMQKIKMANPVADGEGAAD